MKNLFKIGFLVIATAFFFTACEVDPAGPGTGGPGTGTGGTEDAPEIAFVQETGFLSADAQVAAGSTFFVKLTAAKGAADLNGITIREDGVNISDPATRVTIDGAAAPSAAIGTLDSEKSALTWEVGIVAHTDLSTRIYSFTVQDLDLNTDVIDIAIETTDDGGGEVIEPTISLLGSSDRNANPGEKTCYRYNMVAGNPLLKEIAIFGTDAMGETVLLDPARLCFGASGQELEFVSNPLPLAGGDKESFEKNICIRASTAQGIAAYQVVFVDEADNLYISDVTINTAPAGNPVETYVGILWNSGGPAGKGGLDLDSGASTGSSDTAAELKDEGLDQSQTAANNWIQRFSGAQGTQVRRLIPNMNGLPETFTFASVTTDIQIAELWNNGVDFSAINSNGETVSNFVQAGDTYVARRDGKNFLFVITAVNVTPDNNDDNYVMDISF